VSDIQLWHVSLDRTPDEIACLVPLLAPDELARAGRFRDPRLGHRFVAGRASLRQVLGQCLDRDPKDIHFTYHAAGKPELVDVGSHGLHFNLTHSGALAIIAVIRGRPIGVDLERMRTDFASEAIAARFFSPREQAMLSELLQDERAAAFFRCWTRKEAFIKLLGAGLSFPLDEFDVSLAPGAPAELLSVYGDPAAAKRWSLREIAAPPGYFAALAVEGPIDRVVVEET
jgi:4'-phosphopantetheinyl transferase